MPSRLAAICPLLAALACGGPAQPPASPEAPGAEPKGAPEDAATSGEAQSAGSDDAAAPAAPASDEDVNAILQLVVDDPELDTHLHLGEPGRFPLRISGEGLPGSLTVVKATEPVKLVGPPESKKDAVLVITALELSGDKATVRYRYDIEGVRGTVTLVKTPHGWELKNSRLVEH